jgi:hypothetical protein
MDNPQPSAKELWGEKPGGAASLISRLHLVLPTGLFLLVAMRAVQRLNGSGSGSARLRAPWSKI